MSDSKPSFVHVSYIASTADKVFAALTDGKFTQEYWAGHVIESDWKKGSPVLFRSAAAARTTCRASCSSAIRRRCSRTRGHSRAPAADAGDEGDVHDQAGDADNMRLQIVHEAHEPGRQVHEMVREGWSAILSSLKSYLETGKPLEATQNWEKEGR